MKRETEKVSHTPGPWHAYGRMVNDTTETTGGMCRIQMDGNATDSWRFTPSKHYAFCTNPADAPLIAAAPELLAACKSVRDNWDRNLSESMSLINAAIFKATGGAA